MASGSQGELGPAAGEGNGGRTVMEETRKEAIEEGEGVRKSRATAPGLATLRLDCYDRRVDWGRNVSG
jgi:hypothetical protein